MNDAEFLNRDDEIDPEENEEGGDVTHEVVVRFRWTEHCRTTDGVAEQVEDIGHNGDDHEVIGRAIDAFLDLSHLQVGEENHDPDLYPPDQYKFEVVHRESKVSYWDGR